MPSWLAPAVLAEVATSIVFGGMLFFTGVVAPLVFARLPADMAAGFIRQIFPVYYLTMGAAAALAALLAAWTAPFEALLMLLVVIGFALSRQVLMPRINRLRDAQKQGDTRAGRAFGRLHGLSVAINTVQLVLVAAVLFRLAAGAPKVV